MRLSDWSHASTGNVLGNMKAATASTNPAARRDNGIFYFVCGKDGGKKGPETNFVNVD